MHLSMTVTRIFLIVVLAATVFACGKSEKELAAEKLALAKICMKWEIPPKPYSRLTPFRKNTKEQSR